MSALLQEITLRIQDLPPDQLVEVRNFIDFITWRQRHPLSETPSSETKLPPNLTNEEFKQRLDDLTARFKSYVDPDLPPLSDYAVSREGIYGDHL